MARTRIKKLVSKLVSTTSNVAKLYPPKPKKKKKTLFKGVYFSPKYKAQDYHKG